MDHVDVLIVGAGLSGIGAAWHLQTLCPRHSYAIVEARDAIGGTWDLFRYPGVRSDSDMYTLGYHFKPWQQARSIADGSLIRNYLRETAHENGIDKQIRFGHRVRAAAWSSEHARWTVDIDRAGSSVPVQVSCNFLYLGAGYYRYDAGYTPVLPGIETYRGRIVHPQHWGDDIDHAGKRIVVIGSGATAITLLPALAHSAAHVTMLQRSPTYVAALPAEDAAALWLQRHLPPTWASTLNRWSHLLWGTAVFQLCRHKPDRMKQLLLARVRAALPAGFDVGKHFTPRYNPWEQRLCLAPDGDLFKAIRSGKASVVTDQIDHFTATGITLQSGQQLDADLIVTATGLNLQVFGGLQLAVDGEPVDPAHAMAYKGFLFSGLPNFASCFGYTNASWTLRADLTSQFLCRLLTHMRRKGFSQCVPRNDDPALAELPWVDFSSGYFQRALNRLPRQGSHPPWKLHQNYLRDILQLRFGTLNDDVLQFRR
ncbi:MAG: NAD(P)/FAD-dependent oxidoreductase [Betaproteobacteria bacterium]